MDLDFVNEIEVLVEIVGVLFIFLMNIEIFLFLVVMLLFILIWNISVLVVVMLGVINDVIFLFGFCRMIFCFDSCV